MEQQPAGTAITPQQWMNEDHRPEDLPQALRLRGLDDEQIAAFLHDYQRLQLAKRQFGGFLILGVGAFLGLLSCVLAVTNPIPALYNWFLYGITSLALVLIFWGLYRVFG